MDKSQISHLTDFPAMIYCTPPDEANGERWVVLGELEPGIDIRAEHEKLHVALARFGAAYYLLTKDRNAFNEADKIS